MSLKHNFNCAIADDPADAAAGYILISHWNQDHVISNGLDLPAETVTSPAANVVRMYGLKVCGKMQAAIRLSRTEESVYLQPALGRGRVQLVSAMMNSSGISTVGMTSGTSVGTATQAIIGFANKYSTLVRQDILQATASATNVASWRYAANCWSRNASLGGFFTIFRGGVATGASNASSRFYIGLRSSVSSAPTDVDPSTTTQHVGFGWDSTDANAQIMFNDGTGTSSKIDLGASWPVPVADRSEFYELQIYTPRGGTSVFVAVTEVVSGRSFATELTTDLFNSTLGPIIYSSVGGVNDVTGVTFGLFYSELFD